VGRTGKTLEALRALEALVSAPPPEFDAFFHAVYRELLRIAMYVGATQQEAEDAAQTTMEEILRRWAQISDPVAFARRAVVSNFLKDKTRGLGRVRRRQIERGDVTPEVSEDWRLTAWEDRQWVTQMLESLPPAQRQVMAFIVDDFSSAGIARLLGRTPEAIRRNLCDARKQLKAALQRERISEQPGRICDSPREEHDEH
jgi:RNA polymerase sigma factor (sigma-70 family)